MSPKLAVRATEWNRHMEYNWYSHSWMPVSEMEIVYAKSYIKTESPTGRKEVNDLVILDIYSRRSWE